MNAWTFTPSTETFVPDEEAPKKKVGKPTDDVTEKNK